MLLLVLLPLFDFSNQSPKPHSEALNKQSAKNSMTGLNFDIVTPVFRKKEI
jgi:hypothetical protein